MNRYRARCDRLKKIRRAIADKLGIDLHQVECTYEGDCTGTCPKCEQEENRLNKELLRRALGVGAIGLMAFNLSGCTPNLSQMNQLNIDLLEEWMLHNEQLLALVVG